ncbi:hypothetical protein Gpo141_00004802 [Globisporangium polare]
MDPSKREEEEAARKGANASQKRDESKREAGDEEEEGDADNQLDDESKNEMVKRGAVGRRFAVVDLPALEQLAIDDAEKS